MKEPFYIKFESYGKNHPPYYLTKPCIFGHFNVFEVVFFEKKMDLMNVRIRCGERVSIYHNEGYISNLYSFIEMCLTTNQSRVNLIEDYDDYLEKQEKYKR